MYKNIGAAEFEKLINEDPDAVIIDVRTSGETMQGIIPNAIVMDIFDPSFAKKIEMLDRSKNYYMYCRSGNRSASAGGYMTQIGFETVYNLGPGIIGWNGPVVKPENVAS